MSDDHRLAVPFHAGELAAQALAARAAGDGARPLPATVPIRDRMPDQHRAFFAQLPFVCLALPDADGWPWATLLAGQPGFAAAPDASRLTIAALPAADDPARQAIAAGVPAGLLGIDLGTRRRNRANGVVTAAGGTGFEVAIHQSFGNCPRYIHQRSLAPAERAPGPALRFEASLPDAARALVAGATTLFVASTSGSRIAGEAAGLDISHRGGPAGFVAVDGAVLRIPDYAGNGYFNTLGNFVADPRAAIVMADFASGDVLQLQGRATVDWEAETRSWRFAVVRGVWRPGALPLSEADPGDGCVSPASASTTASAGPAARRP
jgi:predicted pyridoxine 5'-phosphate oxidase superfamily flavin-nucleotide-binding protein